MASFNKVILMGNLTREPELKYLPSNTPVVEIGLAVNHRYKKPDGTQVDEVCFVDCTSFGRGAEVISQYCRKGRPLLIEGRLRLDSWTDKDGNKRSKHRVIIDTFTFVDSQRSEGGAPGHDTGHPEGDYPAQPPRQPPRGPAPARPAPPPAPEMPPDDIPF